MTESGFTEQQAETLAEEHVALLNSNLATKADIEALRKELKADIEALRQGTKADIAGIKVDIETVKSDLLKWMFTALIAQGGLIVTGSFPFRTRTSVPEHRPLPCHRRDLRHPDARASASVQNQRSPFLVLTRVAAYQAPPGT